MQTASALDLVLSQRDAGLDLLTQREAADLLGVKESTLERWRFIGAGPRFVKLNGRLVRYQRSALLDYCTSCTRSSTHERAA